MILTEKYICKLCEYDAVRDPFISENGQEVGQHINDDHQLNDIMDWVCFYANGWRKLEGG